MSTPKWWNEDVALELEARFAALEAALVAKDEEITKLNERLDNAGKEFLKLKNAQAPAGKTSRVTRTTARKTFDPKATVNCVYCARDGQDGSGSTQEHVNDHGKEVSARRKAERKKATTAPETSPETPSDDDAPME